MSNPKCPKCCGWTDDYVEWSFILFGRNVPSICPECGEGETTKQQSGASVSAHPEAE